MAVTIPPTVVGDNYFHWKGNAIIILYLAFSSYLAASIGPSLLHLSLHYHHLLLLSLLLLLRLLFATDTRFSFNQP